MSDCAINLHILSKDVGADLHDEGSGRPLIGEGEMRFGQVKNLWSCQIAIPLI